MTRLDLSQITPEAMELHPILKAAATTVHPSKYHNARADANGMTFQSGREAGGIAQLIMLEDRRQGVFGLRLQVRFPLGEDSSYIADAVYLDEKLQVHIIDFKGCRTREYLRKRRLFKKYYGKEIEEI